MIKNTKQDWSIGATVKVGFMKLIVLKAIPTPGDWFPDMYLLTNEAATKWYSFVPHNGLTALSEYEYIETLNEYERNIND